MKKNNLLPVVATAVFGMIILTITNGLTFSGLTVFDEALIEQFSWTKSELKFRDFINLAAAAVIMPFMGAIIDRFGTKVCIIFGLLLLAAGFTAYSYIGSSTHMYLIHLLFAFAVSTAGVLAVIIMVQERVSQNRGLAIGIALAGTSTGSLFMSKLGGVLLESFGWRQAFRYEALLPLGLAVIVFLILKNTDKVREDGTKKTDDLVEITFADALKTKQFWMLSFVGFFCYYSIMAAMGNLFLYMRELDFSSDTAINALGLISMLILGAKFLSGALTDYINKFQLFKIQIFIMMIGGLLFGLYSRDLVWYAIPIFALGWGGLYTLINFIIITTFGVNAAGKIGGTISFFESLGAGLGIWLSGLIADQTGSYAMSFQVITGFLLAALIISLLINPVDKDASMQSSLD